MFSIADLLERAKVNSRIDSDYRLAKVLRINQTSISNYRHRGNIPGDEIIAQLCALSGDDVAVELALANAARAKAGPCYVLWESIAARLSAHNRRTIERLPTAILSVFFTMILLAGHVGDTWASERQMLKNQQVTVIYIV